MPFWWWEFCTQLKQTNKSSLHFILFSAVILCNFEEDLCGWNNVIDRPEWQFERKTSEELVAESRPGPDAGLNGVKNDHFLIAGNLEDSEEGSVAAIQSPYFKSKEHPVECFWFWFYFSVSLIYPHDSNFYMIIINKTQFLFCFSPLSSNSNI